MGRARWGVALPPASRPRWAIDTRVMAGLSLALALLTTLAMLAGRTLGVDEGLLRWLRGATGGGAWWQRDLRLLMHDLTALGDPPMLVLVVLATAAVLVAAQRRRLALAVVAITALGALTGTLLKLLFDRARPAIVPHLVEVGSPSFPSGHAMQSAVIYLTVATLVVRAEADARVRRTVLALAIGLVLLIGASRVYLGVHWPSDVLAGWLVGAAWAAGASVVTRRLQAERRVEAAA